VVGLKARTDQELKRVEVHSLPLPVGLGLGPLVFIDLFPLVQCNCLPIIVPE
jgi:hypothetical protein